MDPPVSAHVACARVTVRGIGQDVPVPTLYRTWPVEAAICTAPRPPFRGADGTTREPVREGRALVRAVLTNPGRRLVHHRIRQTDESLRVVACPRVGVDVRSRPNHVLWCDVHARMHVSPGFRQAHSPPALLEGNLPLNLLLRIAECQQRMQTVIRLTAPVLGNDDLHPTDRPRAESQDVRTRTFLQRRGYRVS